MAVGSNRRRAAAALQTSASHGLPTTTTAAPTGGTGFSNLNLLRRRRSANGALSDPAPPATRPTPPPPAPAPAPTTATTPPSAPTTTGGVQVGGTTHRIRLVPHLDTQRALHFDPISRTVREHDTPLRIGRFTDRSGLGLAAVNAQSTHKLAFKSKVVSRAHAEVWCERGGKFFIKDTKSSSGTFLNHVRLSAPNTESRPFALKDGDVLQLGVDYQGGTEEIYKCVKMRVEVGREWQAGPNAFNTNAMKQLKALSAPTSVAPTYSKSGISDCCICLFGVSVHQSLFIAPCSHVFHYKCIRPLLIMHHPGFSCPMCRTFANLEEDVE
ncbi:SMAD/FHA domain-containing protein, partial [Rickenella mellea]